MWGRSPGEATYRCVAAVLFYVGRSTCEMHCNKSNGMIMHFYFICILLCAFAGA